RYLYTGTHDNPTIREWFEELDPLSYSYKNLNQYMNDHQQLFAPQSELESGAYYPPIIAEAENIHHIMISIAMASGCRNIIIPMQDILGLDASARMNIPGTALGNWQWRMAENILP
ncbi:MAG: 4-alpha-glucanotransferase, partial [Candidatus Cloacimonadaceae bacterium]|nr:4-alpha-glucanotransferase [Candidatus Cloacimonadaceae bacterium]